MKAFNALLLVLAALYTLTYIPAHADNNAGTEQTDNSAQYNQVLNGKIGPYAVKMFLNISGAEDDNTVGYYYYTAYPKNRFKLVLKEMEAINAKGSMHIVLYEYTSQGVHSGTFDGQYECRGDYYAGTFTNSKGKKYHFTLE